MTFYFEYTTSGVERIVGFLQRLPFVASEYTIIILLNGLLGRCVSFDFLLSGDLFRIPNTQRQAFYWLTQCVPFFAFRMVFCSEYAITRLSSAFFSVFMSFFSVQSKSEQAIRPHNISYGM